MRAGIQIWIIISGGWKLFSHKADIDLVQGGLLLYVIAPTSTHYLLLLIDNVEVLVVVHGGRLAASPIVGVVMLPCCGGVVVMHGLLARLRGIVQGEILPEEGRIAVIAQLEIVRLKLVRWLVVIVLAHWMLVQMVLVGLLRVISLALDLSIAMVTENWVVVGCASSRRNFRFFILNWELIVVNVLPAQWVLIVEQGLWQHAALYLSGYRLDNWVPA
jgi:hypothetical protein